MHKLTCSLLTLSVVSTVPAWAFPDKKDLESVKGEVGIAVINADGKKQCSLNEDKPFPMQSVCKMPLSIAILRLADQGKLKVTDKITIKRADVLPIHSPIKNAIKGKQSDFTIRELMTRAICDSDNTACDILIAKAGGAKAVTQILKDAGLESIRIDRPEAILQPESSDIKKFLTDERDTSTPNGMVTLLKKLYSGDLLSKESRSIVLEDMFNCKTGSNRLLAGLPPNWKIAHKTGTGRDIKGQNTATNDVGIIVGPKNQLYFVALFVKGSKAPIEVREALMAKVADQTVRESTSSKRK
ncbi:MAG: class A beta-lactamase [Candidatus Melainabacteria bacterium]|nr:class A beta-lactamase [Candidatus Melainabacteria bacterium]